MPYAYQNASATEQWDADTSKIAMLISQAGSALPLELSPMQIDYILQGYFGDFAGLIFRLATEGLFSGDTTVDEIFGTALENMRGTWASDNRYSNQNVTRYCEILDELDRQVADLQVRGQDVKAGLAYKTRQALNDCTQHISALNKQVRLLNDGPEKDELIEEIVLAAQDALEFHGQCMSGQIQEPKLLAIFLRGSRRQQTRIPPDGRRAK